MSTPLKRILFIDHDPSVTGSTVSLLYLIDAFREDGYEVFILSPKSQIEAEIFIERGARIEYFKSSVVKSFALDLHFTNEFKLFSFAGVVAVLKNLFKILLGIIFAVYTVLKVRPSVLYLNEYVSIQTVIAGLLFRIPSVTHIRSQSVKGNIGLRQKVLRWCLSHLCIMSFAISEEEKKQFIFPGKKSPEIIVVREFLNDKDFSPGIEPGKARQYYSLPEKYTVLTLGGISEIKGTLDILKAAELLLQKKNAIYFIIAGEILQHGIFNKYYRECMKIFARNSEDIKITGLVKDTSSLISASNVLIAPFTRSHFPRPAIEAMAKKKPVITSKTAHASEFIQDRDNGLLVIPGDYKSLAEGILYLYNNSQVAGDIADKGYLTARSEFCASVNTSIIVNLCNNLIMSSK